MKTFYFIILTLLISFNSADARTPDTFNENTFPILRLGMSYNGDTINTMIFFYPSATNGYDFMFDALYLDGFTSFQFASISGSNEFNSNALPPLGTSPVTVPLLTEITLAGSYSIFETEFSNFPAGTQIMLEDSTLAVNHDLTTGAYTFSGNQTVDNYRFKVTITPASGASCSNPPFVSGGGDQTICDGNPATLSATGGHSLEMNVTAAGSGDYTFSGDFSGNDPNINVNVGDSVIFNVNASGHPFWLKTVQGTGSGNSVSVANNGTSSGTIVWIPSAAGTFYYNCEYHAMMTGMITVSASSINYTWDNAVTDGVPFTPTATGVYTVTATDNAGCTATDFITINIVGNLSTNAAAISNYNGAEISCNGAADGEAIVVEVFNGPPPPPFPPPPPLTYLWSDGQTTSVASGLIAGTYIATVTNVNGCSDTSSVIISEPNILSIGIDSLVDASCTNLGSISITSSGGTPTYSYLWSDGSISEDATGLAGGNNYSVTLTDANGCLATNSAFVNTLGTSTTSTDVQTACNSYTWIDGNTYTSSNNTATYTITNSAGCDSIITLNLSIGTPNTGTDVQTACNAYTWIDGNTYTSSNNTATYTLTNASGCDSVVTLNLTVGSGATSTDVQTACNAYTWIDGNTYTSSNNTATYTITNSAGCDSVITLNLTIGTPNTGTDVQTACDVFTWIDGNTYTSSNNSATHTLTNASGCDSVITLNLTMNNNSTAIDSVTAWCSYTWIDGNTYFANDSTTTFTLTNAAGCDSVITLNLSILSVSSGITNFNSTLTSSVSQFTGATYQWVDCNNNYATISGETNPTFTPTSNGSYAVVVYLNSCADTSSCENVIISSIVEKSTEIAPKIFPNPTSGKLTIEFENLIEQFQIKIYDATGRLLSAAGFQNQRVIQLPMDYPAGPYFLNILTQKDRLVIPVIKK